MLFSPINTFLSNLKTLGFDQTIHCKGLYTNISLQPDHFILNTRSFEVTSHFLFRCLDKARTRKDFKTCWPPTTKQRSKEYTVISIRWLQELKETHPLLTFIPIRKSYFEDCHSQMMNRIMMVFSTLVLETVLCRSTQNVKTNFSNKQALEDEIQSLSVQVTQRIQTIQDSKNEWRQEGEHIIKSLERTTLDTKNRPERVNYMEIKLQLEKTLRQIKKKKLSKLKSNNELRKRLAQIVNAPQEMDPFFVLPKLPTKEEEEEDYKHNDREPSFIKEVQSYINIDQNEENMEHDHDEEDASSLLNDMESVAYIGSEDPPSAFMYEDIRTPQQMRTPQRTSQVYQDEALFDLNLLTPLRRSVTPRRWSHLGGF